MPIYSITKTGYVSCTDKDNHNVPPIDRHSLNRIHAYRHLKKLASMQTPQAKFYFLRSIDPFVFEEMILTALKRQGHGIIRNAAYTGDGGADGCVFIDNERYLIQAKRYRGHIKRSDIDAFAAMCQRRKAKGMFVHTGKTGKTSRQLAYRHKLTLISGQQLLDLLHPPVIRLTPIAKENFAKAKPSLHITFYEAAI